MVLKNVQIDTILTQFWLMELFYRYGDREVKVDFLYFR